jgi:predicted translin family RNA/ssDNA-binding protein
MSEITATTIGELGRQVAEAIARGDFDRARELTEEGIQLRSSAPRG